MSLPAIACSRCRAPIPAHGWNRLDTVPCAGCGARLQADVFPAFFRGLGPSHAPAEILEGEASCFAHPRKRAVVPCDGCGRFLCALCDVEFGGRHLCPTCLETGKSKGKLRNLENSRTLYDRMALALAIYPMLFFYLSILGAPMALFVSIRYWKAPRSIIGGTRARFVVAIVLAVLEIVGWVVLIVFVVNVLSTRPKP